MVVKWWPGIFDFKKRRGETADNFESRMKETGGKSNWRPSDGKGVRDTKQPGRQFSRPAAPDRGK